MSGSFCVSDEGVVGFYGCKSYGFTRPLDIPTDHGVVTNMIIAYTDGLVLLRTKSSQGETYRVGNPVLNQWVHLPRYTYNPSQATGLVTRVEDGVILEYKVVVIDDEHFENGTLSFNIYSSEKGTWTSKKVRCPRRIILCTKRSLCLNKMLHWLDDHYISPAGAIVAYDFYDSDEEQQCRVIPFPDQKACSRTRRAYTTSGGFLFYINKIHLVLKLWRLGEYTSDSGRWQFMQEINLQSFGCDHRYFPMAMHPFETHIIYMGTKDKALVSIDLKTRKLTLHTKSSTYSDTMLSHYLDLVYKFADQFFDNHVFYTPQFILPHWISAVPRPPPI